MRSPVLPFSLVAWLGIGAAVETDSPPKLWRPSGKKVHDPWKKFCGSTFCYDILEVSEDATEDVIKKSYRKLAREWHPDKNPEKGARAKFQKIAKAYEVLSTEGERAKYDLMMRNPAEYRKAYGEYYWKFKPPPTDATFVIILILVLMSGIHYAILKQRHEEYNEWLLKMCIANKGPSQGGSIEIQEIHQLALERCDGAKGKKGKTIKADDKFKATVNDVLVEEDMFALKPSVWDTFGAKALMLPINILKPSATKGGPHSEEEKIHLLKRAIDDWDDLSKKKQAELMEREAWTWDADSLTSWRRGVSKKLK